MKFIKIVSLQFHFPYASKCLTLPLCITLSQWIFHVSLTGAHQICLTYGARQVLRYDQFQVISGKLHKSKFLIQKEKTWNRCIAEMNFNGERMWIDSNRFLIDFNVGVIWTSYSISFV